ncbi:EexN family lipoprotein [Robbsia betulipollinis]|uniref:EexN family lipoprotein n=1 Tax=Robbsia betulipollinis TaxID=2981849 RepID=UPI003D7A22C8
MEKKLNFICVGTALTLLFSCGKSPESIEWYRQHEAERNATLATCKKVANRADWNQDCRNAIDAEASSGTFTRSPEMKW